MNMRITVLVDNNTYIDRYYLGEPAFCALIEDGAHTILFDTGYSDVFIENARRMGIDLSAVTDIALSHGHNDHTGGLGAFLATYRQPVRLFAHPDAFCVRRDHDLDVGCPIALADLPAQVTPKLIKQPARISPHVTFLGRIDRHYEFEQARAVGQMRGANGAWQPDPLRDDASLVLHTEQGGFLVTGCAHAGVCNTVHAAFAVGEAQVIGVLGGFHLFEANEAAQKTAETLSGFGIRDLYPCHCTSLAVKCLLAQTLRVHEVGVGLVMDL